MFARTERLLLRPGWAEDAHCLTEAINHDSIIRNLGWGRWPANIESAERWLRQVRDAHLPRLLVLSRTDDSPELVGGVGLHRMDDGAVEMDFWTSPHKWGLGFATEAAKAMLGIAQALGLRRIAACAFLSEGSAARVLEKLGFVATGSTMRRSSGDRDLFPAIRFDRRLETNNVDRMSLLAA